jgi:hypothetical protein
MEIAIITFGWQNFRNDKEQMNCKQINQHSIANKLLILYENNHLTRWASFHKYGNIHCDGHSEIYMEFQV